jgi:hypothetical protein
LPGEEGDKPHKTYSIFLQSETKYPSLCYTTLYIVLSILIYGTKILVFLMCLIVTCVAMLGIESTRLPLFVSFYLVYFIISSRYQADVSHYYNPHRGDGIKVDDQGWSNLLPVQGKCPKFISSSLHHPLMEDLLFLALDPLYGIERGLPQEYSKHH